MMIQMLMMMIIVKMGMMMKKFMMMGIVRLEAASRQHRSIGPLVSGPSPDLWFRCHQHQQCSFNIITIVFILIILIIFTIANLYDEEISVQHKPAGSTSTSILNTSILQYFTTNREREREREREIGFSNSTLKHRKRMKAQKIRDCDDYVSNADNFLLRQL